MASLSISQEIVAFRRATAADAAEVATVYIASRRAAAAYLPTVGTDAEIRAFVIDRMVPERETWVAEAGGRIVAVMVLDGDMVDQFYVFPANQRRGVGDAMLAHAKQLRPARLRLWAFQRNTSARRFYEARGFIAKEFTGGATNMEREPDVLYEWMPCTGRSSGLQGSCNRRLKTEVPGKSRFISGPAIVAFVSALELILHLPNPGGYGLFVDELYFLACGQHLSWGYVDMPPLTALQAWTARAFLGDSLLAIRLLPALAGTGLVLLTGALVRQLEGRRFAQALAAVAVLVAPFYLAFDSYLSMNSVEPLLWMGCVLILIRMIKTGDTRLWIWFGVLAGVGLENKDTMAMFGFALVVGLLMTPERRLMGSRWFFIGAMTAVLIFIPNLIWMVQHHFPHLEMLANIRRNRRNVALSPLGFIGQQVLGMQPVALPIWLCGLWGFLFSYHGRPYRALGLAYLVTLLTLLLAQGRFYYLAPAYPMLIAGGAVSIERWLTAPQWRWVRPTYLSLLAVTGGLIALIVLPLLPPETYLRYTHFIGISQPKFEHRQASELPQLLADRFGWPEMAAAVAKVYDSLPADARAQTAIFGQNYGEAGAIDFYGPKLGLPKAISGHANYWYWGPRGYTGESMIVLGDIPRERLEQYFARVEERGSVGNRYAMASEHFSIYLCREPKGGETLNQLWPKLKNWN